MGERRPSGGTVRVGGGDRGIKLVYVRGTAKLPYDADGFGTGTDAVLAAALRTIAPRPALADADFTVA